MDHTKYDKLKLSLNIVLILSMLMLAVGTYYGTHRWEAIESAKDV